jgi:MFS family permease
VRPPPRRYALPESALADSAAIPWHRTITREPWRALLAAKSGWMLDAADFMLYAMALGHLRAWFEMDDRTAGLLATTTLIMSGIGGLLFGYVADRFGRVRALSWTILIFSLASLGASTSQTIVQLALWRAALGIGMGGEWASGAVLVSETWPAAHRNKASAIMQSGWALGYIAAALLAAAVLGESSPAEQRWRWLFVAGVLPALFTLWIRRHVQEPDTWTRMARGPASPAGHPAPCRRTDCRRGSQCTCWQRTPRAAR